MSASALLRAAPARPRPAILSSAVAGMLPAALALLLGLGTAAPARAAEVEVGPIVGAHFFSDDNQLGRYLNGPPNLAPQHMALAGLRLSVSPWEHLALEAEVALIPTWTRADPQPLSPVLTYRGALRIDLLTGRIRPFARLGGGAMMLLPTSTLVRSSTQEFLDLGVGSLFDLGRNFGLRVDLRLLFVPSVERMAITSTGTQLDLVTQDFELLVGLYWRFGSHAGGASGAGAATAVARAEKAGGEAEAPPARDGDGDGVGDEADRCPAQPGPPENRGCPDEDGDGDGIVDRLDRCPAAPGPAAGQGCPDTDRDLDATVDREDRCPDRPGPRENHGCPDVDQDGDGIVDRLDRCPDRAENKNRFQDDDGCPDELPADLQRIVGVVAGLDWKGSTSVEMKKDSLALLDETARVLAEHPELRIEIGAHTDNSGNIVKNTHLSQRRADALREYLVKKGIARARLRSVGYGPTRPVGDNQTADGRAENRRVEIQLVP